MSSLQSHGKALEKECCLPGVFCDSGNTPAQWRRNYGDSLTGGNIVPAKFRTCTLQVKDAAYVKNFKQTTLTTRLYMVRTNLYPPPTYENVPTRLRLPMSCVSYYYYYYLPPEITSAGICPSGWGQDLEL